MIILQLINLNIEDIIFDPKQNRTAIENTDIEGLADSIKNFGVREPIKVFRLNKLDGDEFYLCKGARRLLASKLADQTTIPCLVIEAGQQSRVLRDLYRVESLAKIKHSPVDLATSFDRLKKCGLDYLEIARFIGISATSSKSIISRYISLLSLPQHIKSLVDSRKLSFSAGYELSLHTSTIDHNALTEIANKAVSDELSIRQIRLLIKSFLNGDPKVINLENTNAELLRKHYGVNFEKNMQMVFKHLFDVDVGYKCKSNGEITISMKYKNPQELTAALVKLQQAAVAVDSGESLKQSGA